MSFLNNILKKILIFLSAIAVLSLISSCGNIWDPADARKVSSNSKERVRKNLEEGKGISFGNLAGRGGTSYQFASSNPMWRATLEILDFLPLKSSLFETVIVSANDTLVELFLNNKINFIDIQKKLFKIINKKKFLKLKNKYPKKIQDIVELNNYVRLKTLENSI